MKVTSPLDEGQQNFRDGALTYGRSKEALLPVLNVDKIDNGFYPHKLLTSLFCIYYGSCPIKDLKDTDTPVGRMYAKRKMGRVKLSKDIKMRVRGTEYATDKGWNVGHLWDFKYGGTNWNIDNFIVQNAVVNSVDGQRSATPNRFEQQLKSEHHDSVYEKVIICLNPKIEGESIQPASFLRLERFVPALPLNDETEAEWMVIRIYNPEPEEMKIFKELHPSRKPAECYVYDFGAKNGDEAQLLTELAKLLDHDKKPEGNNSIKQLEGNEYHKELENLIMDIIKELHTPDELCQSFKLPDGMKKSEGEAVLKALLQADEPPAVLYLYTSNLKCFTADPEREIKIKKIFAGKAPDYANKKIKDAIDELQKWKSIASIAQRDDSGIGTAENTTNAENEASPPLDDKTPKVISRDFDVDEDEALMFTNQADDERDQVFPCLGRATSSPQLNESTSSDAFLHVSMPEVDESDAVDDLGHSEIATTNSNGINK
ncbi:unnamed protein product, partial [Mesorhabditis belari]|uniref:Uncharacterized protein n=1 Tax=Mesorhabditis belari TaxID=2138241 RepID=A0AAF3FM13_9BILA